MSLLANKVGFSRLKTMSTKISKVMSSSPNLLNGRLSLHRNKVHFLAVQNSSIGDLVTDSLTESLTDSLTVTVLLLLTHKEQHQRLVTFETSDLRS